MPRAPIERAVAQTDFRAWRRSAAAADSSLSSDWEKSHAGSNWQVGVIQG
jgi:hypothetical protein